MNNETIVSVHNVSKRYLLYRRPQDRLKQSLFFRFGRNYAREFWALRDIDIDVRRGETLGIIGQNGSGKSTLLQIIAGVLQPTDGCVEVSGRVAALLELGTGFNPEFTGQENVFLNGSILGFSQSEMRERFDAIAAFADIGPFMDQPVKLYSSGMYVRLAFAIAACVDPDVLIVDEALAVGDAYFQQRCMRRIREFRESGKAILLVTHDGATVKNLCDRALWLSQGQIRDLGEPERVVSRYLAEMFGHLERETAMAMPVRVGKITSESLVKSDKLAMETELPNINRRFGDGRAEIVGIGTYDSDSQRTSTIGQGKPVHIRVSLRFKDLLPHPIVGYVFRNQYGVDLAGTNTDIEGLNLPMGRPGKSYTVRFVIDMPILMPGQYTLTVALADGNYVNYTMCDWIDDIVSLVVIGKEPIHTQLRFPTQCQYETDEE